MAAQNMPIAFQVYFQMLCAISVIVGYEGIKHSILAASKRLPYNSYLVEPSSIRTASSSGAGHLLRQEQHAPIFEKRKSPQMDPFI